MTAATRPRPTSGQPRPARLACSTGPRLRRARRRPAHHPRARRPSCPALIIPLFFFVVNVGALQKFVEASAPPGFNYKAFQLPLAIITAVTGVSPRQLPGDRHPGRLLRPPAAHAHPPGLAAARADGGRLRAGHPARPSRCSSSASSSGCGSRPGSRACWSSCCWPGSGAWSSPASRTPSRCETGNPAAVNSSFLLFFPFVFLTTAFLPKEALTGWLAAIATVNPVTYMLAAMRSLIQVGWDVEGARPGGRRHRHHGRDQHAAGLRRAAWSAEAWLRSPAWSSAAGGDLGSMGRASRRSRSCSMPGLRSRLAVAAVVAAHGGRRLRPASATAAATAAPPTAPNLTITPVVGSLAYPWDVDWLPGRHDALHPARPAGCTWLTRRHAGRS